MFPSASHTPEDISLALGLRTWSRGIGIVGSLAVIALGVALWRGMRWWGKSVYALLVGVMALVTWFAHQNHFEWLFRPLAASAFVSANEASFVQPSERVLGVTEGGESAAYPIRQIAYHHVVHDSIGGRPVVVTY